MNLKHDILPKSKIYCTKIENCFYQFMYSGKMLKHMSFKKDQRFEFITCVGIYEGMILLRFIDIFRCWLVLGRPRWRKWPSRKSDRNSRLVRIYLPTSIWRDFHLSTETEVNDIFFIFRSSSSPRSAAYIMWDTGQGK